MTMKHLTICIFALFSLVLAPSLHAATAPGKVQALLVVGDVQLVDATGNKQPLTKGQTFQEGSTVMAGKDSGATLVFSNGATMKVTAGAQLTVSKFQQAPFDETKEGTFLRLQRDPSQSITQLDLRNGTLQGEVKELDTKDNSSFTVNTPAGSAGIRGTVVSISVVRDASGKVTGVTAVCPVGAFAFSSSTGGTPAMDVSNGGALTIAVTVDPTTGAVTGASITGATVTSAQATAMLATVYTAINDARASLGLAPVTPPTVSGTPSVTTSGGATVTTVPLADDQPSTTVFNNIQPSSPGNNGNGGNPAPPPGSGATQTTSGTGSETTNPSVPVSPQ